MSHKCLVSQAEVNHGDHTQHIFIFTHGDEAVDCIIPLQVGSTVLEENLEIGSWNRTRNPMK